MTSSSLEPRFIAIEGCIGAGKTSLVNLLGEQFDAQIIREVDDENPFIDKFYQDRDSFGFQTQIFFFTKPLQPIYEANPERPFQFCCPGRLSFSQRPAICRPKLERPRT